MYRIFLSAVGLVLFSAVCSATEIVTVQRNSDAYWNGNGPRYTVLKLSPDESMEFASKEKPEKIVKLKDGGKYEWLRWDGLAYTNNIDTAEHKSGRDYPQDYAPLFLLNGLSFQYSKLYQCDFGNTLLEKCNFTEAGLCGTSLAVDKDCIFTGAVIGADAETSYHPEKGCGISIKLMTADQLKATKSYEKKSLIKCSFQSCNFEGVDFSKCDLTGTKFEPAAVDHKSKWNYWSQREEGKKGNVLSQCRFVGANLQKVLFENAVLDNADFTGADLRDTNFRLVYGIGSCNFTDAVVERASVGLSRKQLESTASFKSKRLIDTQFRGGDWIGVNLTGFNLSGSSFTVTLHNANFTDAIITGCDFYPFPKRKDAFRSEYMPEEKYASPSTSTLTAEQIKSTWNWKHNRMEGIILPPALAKELNLNKPSDKQQGEQP